MALKYLIFDLDDTLLDTTGLLIPIANTPAFEERIQKPLPLLAGAQENLLALKAKYTLFLLTQGRRHFQNQKIQSLKVAHFFEEILIVDPSNDSNGNVSSKALAFQNWKARLNWHPGEFLSLGNRIATDLQPAQDLGGITCWFRHGEHKDVGPEPGKEPPHFSVFQHSQLIPTCRL